MRAIVFSVTCLAILIATSCGDKAVTPIQPPETETQIVGNWLWLESCGGIGGICIGPSRIGSEGIAFTTEGKFYYWCDVCSFPKVFDYRIEQKTSYFYGSDTIVTAIVFKHEIATFVDLIIKQLDNNGLTVIEDCGDCYESVYSKNQ